MAIASSVGEDQKAPASAIRPREGLAAEVWRRQLLTQPLHTTTGQRLSIVYGGRFCCDHGPDFRAALITFDDELRHGDVEIHVRATDWRSHGHYLDPAYNQVILHAYLLPANSAPSTTAERADGTRVPALCLASHLPAELDDLAETLTTAQYIPWHCAERGHAIDMLALLDQAGAQRLQGKAMVYEGELASAPAEEVLYRAIMAALGYSRNTATCAQLAEIVPFALVRAIGLHHRAEERAGVLASFLLLKAGLLDATAGQSESLAAWDDGSRITLPWRFGRVRPGNHPSRRLVAAAGLFAPLIEDDLCVRLTEMLREPPPDACRELQLLLTGRESARRKHRLVAAEARAAPTEAQRGYSIGDARAAEIAVNAVLPFAVAYSEMHGDGQLSQGAWAAFRHYPWADSNEITRHMAEILFDPLDPPGHAALRIASRQQGLLHIYKRWCQDKRCAECIV